jgi:integrase
MSNANQDLTPTTPEEALDLYLRERSTDVTESTLQAHEYRLNHFVRWCNGEGEIENVNTLTGRELHRYKLWRQEDGDLNKVSLKSQMDTLRVFVRFCETVDAVETDLHSKIISPTLGDGTGQRDVKLDADEAEALLNYLERFEYASFAHTLVLLLWRTGMRIGSIRSLDVSDFRADDEYLSVNHRPDTDTPLKNKGKGERFVALTPSVCAVIEDYIDVHRDDVTDDYGRKPLLTTENGRPINNTLRQTVYRWTRPCQYQGDCPHGKEIEECEAITDRGRASRCPSSVSPHAIRRGSITHHLTEDVPETVVSDRMNVSQGVLDAHYDRRDEEVKVEQRRGYLEGV